MVEQPSFYSIMPANLRYDERLSSAEKIFYSEITCRTNALGYCFTSNSTFAELYKKDVRTITRWVTHLNELGYIKLELVKDKNNQITQRKIYINDKGGIDKNVHRGMDKNVGRGIDKNVLYNNININNNTHSTLAENFEYAPKVKLSENEHSKLINEYGEDKTNKCIEELSLYKLSSGKEYHNDYSAIKRWVIDKVNKKGSENKSKRTKPNFEQRDYDIDLNILYANNNFEEGFDSC